MSSSITVDRELLDDITSRFDLRLPNQTGLAATVKHLAHAGGDYVELVNDLATGVGKTFLMAALVEYLAVQGVRNILIVTPGSTIQKKTLANFNPSSPKFIAGADYRSTLITPDNFRTAAIGSALHDTNQLKVFVFNVQQLIRPTASNSRQVYEVDENLGDALYEHLRSQEDLVVITDEHHVYHQKAASFSAAIRSLQPLALVGLTATPTKADEDKVIFQYTLAEAIADGLVKIPVLVYRQDGMKDERTRLADACHLLKRKSAAYELYHSQTPGSAAVRPALFVVCQDIEHAAEVGQLLAGNEFIGDPAAVLEITSQSSDEALAALDAVESPDSPIRAIVSVNMLREGWDVKNIAVIAALRKLDSEMLTEQILGRGLRLPFGQRTNVPEVDQVDLVAHDSYQKLLAKKDILNARLQPKPRKDLERTLPYDVDKPAEQQPAAVAENLPDYQGQRQLFPDPIDVEADGRGGWESLSTPTSGLISRDFSVRIDEPQPEYQGRVTDAPTLVFPLEQSKLVQTRFTLSSVADTDAESLGRRYARELPLFLRRVALEATRTGNEIGVNATPQQQVEARQVMAPIDTVREELVAAVMAQPEVEATKQQKGAARRIVSAFLTGAGATTDETTAAWSENRKKMAIEGLRDLIRAAVSQRTTERQNVLVPVDLPLEPVLVDPSVPSAYSSVFVRRAQYKGWRRNIMPVASFDAKSTEWEIAHIIDNDDAVQWWLRLESTGPAWIPTEKGRYFPDFIVIDREGTRWVVEGKSDKESTDPTVLQKKKSAEQWARSVRDEGDENFGQWRYMFITETDVKRSSGSWNGLLTVTNPE